jgi:dinuclear metal center YbgI/SA1388 family protein
MVVKELLSILEDIAPAAYQESYDNVGLLTGSPKTIISNILVTLDCTESVVEEAIHKSCNVIVAHHPIIFSGLKKITGANYVERTIIKAIKHDICIIAVHTNLDNVSHGVNAGIAAKLGLVNTTILQPKESMLCKLLCYIPKAHAEEVSMALFEAGCGDIGNYSHAGFMSEGIGTFKGNEQSNPTIGCPNQMERVEEIKFETIFPAHQQQKILQTLFRVHPYEEVAYNIFSLKNHYQGMGSGAIGELKEPMEPELFMAYLKKQMGLQVIRHTALGNEKIHKVAVCGGSGSFLLQKAIAAGAQVYISADFKYHEFFDADHKITIADIGHYESEQFTKDLLISHLSKKISKFAPLLSEINTNPIKYYY